MKTTLLAFALLLLTTLLSRADFLIPDIDSWGLESGSGPQPPGTVIDFALSLGGTRNNPTQSNTLNVGIYLSQTMNSISSPAVQVTTVPCTVPGNATQGPTAQGSFTIPSTFNGRAITAGTYYVVYYAQGDTGSSIVSSTLIIGLPAIQVQQPAGTTLTNGTSTVSFGGTGIGDTVSLTFNVANPGTTNLTGLGITIGGTNASMFSVKTAAISPVTPNNSTFFVISFVPTSAGAKTASIQIANNVSGSNPFTVNLTGSGVLAPVINTLAATSVTSTSAVLNGNVNAENDTVQPQFNYGPTTSYGSNASSSPATVTGGSATAVSAALTGLTPGTTYHFRLTGNNGGGLTLGTDTTFTTLTVAQNWLQTYFGTTSATGSAAPTADPNNNGISNLMEYALGGNPLTGAAEGSILPATSINPTTNTLQLSFMRFMDHTDLTEVVQGADSPAGPWTNLATSTAGGAFTSDASGVTVSETGTGNARAVTVTDLYEANDPAHPQRFMRLQVSQ